MIPLFSGCPCCITNGSPTESGKPNEIKKDAPRLYFHQADHDAKTRAAVIWACNSPECHYPCGFNGIIPNKQGCYKKIVFSD
jgi:hypothetical protein